MSVGLRANLWLTACHGALLFDLLGKVRASDNLSDLSDFG